MSNEKDDPEDCIVATELAQLVQGSIDHGPVPHKHIALVRKTSDVNEVFEIVLTTGAVYTVLIDKRVRRETPEKGRKR